MGTVVVPAQSGQWFHGELMIAGMSVDATSGLAGVEVSLNGGKTWLTASGGEVWTFTWDTRLYGDGLYGVRVRGADQAGNVETPVSIDIGVDNSGPFFDVGPFPGEHCFGCSGPITFKLTAFDDQSKIDNTAIVVKKDGKDVRVIKAPNGELRGVPVVWDGKDDSGQPVAPGDYQLLFYTANHAGLFGSYGAGIQVVDALPAAPVPAPIAPVDPPEHTPWIMTPIPPTPAAPVSGEGTGLVLAAPQQAAVASQATVSSNTSSLTGATGGTSGKNNGAAATGLAALLIAAGAYIAARQTMGDKSLAQKLAGLAGTWKPSAKPAAPPAPKVAPPKAPPPPPPAPPQPKPLRWNEIPHTPPAPPIPPQPVYYAPPVVVKAKNKYKWFKSSKPPIPIYARPWLSGMSNSSNTQKKWPGRGALLGGGFGGNRRPSTYMEWHVTGTSGASLSPTGWTSEGVGTTGLAAAGVVAVLDTPVPGPADGVALVILAVTAIVYTGLVVSESNILLAKHGKTNVLGDEHRKYLQQAENAAGVTWAGSGQPPNRKICNALKVIEQVARGGPNKDSHVARVIRRTYKAIGCDRDLSQQ